MDVKIKETGETRELFIIDRLTGLNWVNDLIGNAGALDDGQFTWSDEDDAFIASQDTFDWWQQYINDTLATDEDAALLAEELDIDVSIIREQIEKETGNDYGDHRAEALRTMDEIRREYRDNWFE